jgi:2-haloacid dehalogenase
MQGITVLLFDFYGTLVDMQAGLTDGLTPFLRERGYTGLPGRVVTWWRRTHFENSMIDALLHREHTPYREIGRRALSYTLERAGVPFTRAEVEDLVNRIERLEPFPDVPAALDRLRARYQLAVLSNGDPDMLERGVSYSGLHMDRVMSVAVAASFKPHAATYRAAALLLGQPRENILFVANHPFDCVGAKAFGMRTAYINRRGRPFGETPHAPDIEVANFAELAALLTQ